MFEWLAAGGVSPRVLVAIGLVIWLGSGCVGSGPERGRVLSVGGFQLYPDELSFPGRAWCIGIRATGEYCQRDLDPATPADVRVRAGQIRGRYGGDLPMVVFSDDNARVGSLRSLLQELEAGADVYRIVLAGVRGPAEKKLDFVPLPFEGRRLLVDGQLPPSQVIKLTTKVVYLGDRACDSIQGLRNLLPPSIEGGKDVSYALDCDDDVRVAVLVECLFLLKGEGYTGSYYLATRQGKP